jgi:hypothetical protein
MTGQVEGTDRQFPTDSSATREPSELARSAELQPETEATAAQPISRGDPASGLPRISAVESNRRLLGAAFDLLGRTSDDMRRASFYIGILVLLTIGPAAVGSWALEVVAVHHRAAGLRTLVGDVGYAWYGLLIYLALGGLIVAVVESRTLAAGLLGGRMAQHPVTVRQALARSRMVFWRAIVASVIVAIPVAIAQVAVDGAATLIFGPQVDLSVPASLIAALAGAPFAYLLTGIVLGDVDPIEATRRSFRVFRARKVSAAIVVLFETIALVLVVLGLSAGLDLVLRLFDALGLGVDSGPAGLALITVGLVVFVFAFGTLLYTAFAISIAPQVVMFVGLTHASMGLDHVRRGGRADPDVALPGRRRFRWMTRPVLIGAGLGVLALAVFVGRMT